MFDAEFLQVSVNKKISIKLKKYIFRSFINKNEKILINIKRLFNFFNIKKKQQVEITNKTKNYYFLIVYQRVYLYYYYYFIK